MKYQQFSHTSTVVTICAQENVNLAGCMHWYSLPAGMQRAWHHMLATPFNAIIEELGVFNMQACARAYEQID